MTSSDDFTFYFNTIFIPRVLLWCSNVPLCSLSDTTVLDLVKDDPDKFPVIGDVRQLDITMQHSSCQQYLIRIKQSREKCEETFQLLEVLLKPGKPYVFDCLNLERYVCIYCKSIVMHLQYMPCVCVHSVWCVRCIVIGEVVTSTDCKVIAIGIDCKTCPASIADTMWS